MPRGTATMSMRLFTHSARCRGLLSLLSLTSVVAGNTTDTLWLTAVAYVSGNSGGKFSCQSCLSVATSMFLVHRPESGCGRAWSVLAVKRQVSIAALCRKLSTNISNKYGTDLIKNCLCLCSLSSCEPQRNAVREVIQNKASLPHKNVIHGVTKLVIFSSENSTPLGSLQRSPVPLALRRRGEGARFAPLFKLLGFQASEPPSTFCRIT